MKQMYKNLDDLAQDINFCNKCPLSNTRQNVVFGEGNKKASLMIIAEAPGYDEDKIGRPFVGKAGKLLDSVLDELDISRKDIYISNIIKCHPDGNRNPLPNEIQACLDYLRNQVMIIKPRIIILLGSVALKTILGNEYFITRDRGKFIEKKGILYMPTFHPSAVLRDINKKPDFIHDIKLCKEKLSNFLAINK